MIKLRYEVAFVFGTVILIIISIAWVELLAIIRTELTQGMNPIFSQLLFTGIITIVGVLLLWWMQPAIDDIKGVESGLRAEREILELPI